MMMIETLIYENDVTIHELKIDVKWENGDERASIVEQKLKWNSWNVYVFYVDSKYKFPLANLS